MFIMLPDSLTLLLWLAAGVASLFSLLGFLSQVDWKFELFSHFRTQYALLLCICLLAFLVGGNLPGVLVSLFFLAINLALILPIYRRITRREARMKFYRLFFANILGTNTHYEQLILAIRKTDADTILLVEVRHNHLEQLLPALADYPYQFTQPDVKNFGLAIFSRLPLGSTQALCFDERCTPALVARLIIDETPLTLVGIHPYPPKSRTQAAQRDHQLKLTAEFVRSQPNELMLAGDLNCSSWSHTFQQLLKDSHLLDSRQGIGLQPSWPAGNPLLRIPIDHVLYTPGICIQARKWGQPTGSDHLPVIVDFSIVTTTHAQGGKK